MDFASLTAGQSVAALIGNNIYYPQVYYKITNTTTITSTADTAQVVETFEIKLVVDHFYGAGDEPGNSLWLYVNGVRTTCNSKDTGTEAPAWDITGTEVNKFGLTKEEVLNQL